MEKIIDKIDIEILKKELNDDRFLRRTNKANNEIYIINHHNSPNVMREIGRLREVTFREAGGGTGMALDIDDYDTSDRAYEQLVLYSPEDEEIIGGYRFAKCGKTFNKKTNKYELSTLHYFNFTDIFYEKYIDITIELGRSWIQPNFQPSVNRAKGMFALDNIWDGLGAIILDNPDIEYLSGKVTMYPDYNTKARDALLYFMKTYFPDVEGLMTPIHPLKLETEKSVLKKLYDGLEYKEAYKVLNSFVRERGEMIPPLISSYMGVSPTMKSFGTALNEDFGSVEETCIMVRIDDIYENKRTRHTDTYERDKVR